MFALNCSWLQKILLIILSIIIVLLITTGTDGQTVMPKKNAPIDAAMQRAIIDSVLVALDSFYVYPETALKMDTAIRRKLKKNAYKGITDPDEFAMKLTDDLRDVCHDRHLGIRYFADLKPDDTTAAELTPEEKARQLRIRQFQNFGFEEVKHLTGNVGYLDLRGFSDAADAGPTAVAAMNFLANSDAVIIDLRENGGGSPSMIQLISSYFLDEPTHLNSFYLRPEDTVYQFWSQAYVPGKKMADMDLYILTSSRTFSAAEEFTYNMRNLKRATIVGETTGGGAHPVDEFKFPSIKIGMRIPTGRAINPVTNTNWEGVGVEPHVKIAAAQALDKAHLMALEKIRDREKDEDLLVMINWGIDGLQAKLNPVALSDEQLQKFVGVYGPRKITLVDGELIYQRDDRPPYKLIPMTEKMFRIAELDFFRMTFEFDADGRAVKVIGLYDNGMRDENERNDNM